MKKPRLKEVKAHFKNAKVVKCLVDGTYDLTEIKRVKDIHKSSGNYYLEVEDDYIKLYDGYTNKFAEILEYKDNIKEIAKDNFGTKYTKEQLLKHGDLILEYLRNPEMEIDVYTFDGLWIKVINPSFHTHTEYRKKPAVIFTNEIGEEFTQNDIDNSILAYWFCLDTFDVDSECFSGIPSDEYRATNNTTSLSKTELGALKLAVKQLETLNNTKQNEE